MFLVFVNKILAIFTIISLILLGVGLVYFLAFRQDKTNRIINFFGKHGLALAFFISLFATIFSLFYSEVAGFEPCKLCWWQRIFMYALVLLLGQALLKKDYKILSYGLTFAVAGSLVALYHNYIYYGGTSLFPCDAAGLGVSCAKRYMSEFGFITIPLVSLASFLLAAAFLWLQKFYNQK